MLFLLGVTFSVLVRWALVQMRPGAAASTHETASAEPSVPVVSIVGNIGSGKTRALCDFVDEYENAAKCRVVCEPISEWEPLLSASAESPDAWRHLQVAAADFYATLFSESSLKAKTGEANPKLIITERDPASVAIFSNDDPCLSQMLEAFAGVGALWLPAAVVFIATSWETCYDRVKNGRSQPGDVAALKGGPTYFKRLHKRHVALTEWYHAQGVLVITVADDSLVPLALSDLYAGFTDCSDDCIESRPPSNRPISREAMTSLLTSLARVGI